MSYRKLFVMACCGTLIACGHVGNVPASNTRVDGPSSYTVYWDLPERDDFWIPKGTDWDTVLRVADECNAQLLTGLRWHDPYPPQFENAYFKFKGSPSQQVRSCVVGRLKATPALTTYAKKK